MSAARYPKWTKILYKKVILRPENHDVAIGGLEWDGNVTLRLFFD